LLKTITDRYNGQTSPYYAASRLWVDAIIDPVETRNVISESLTAANQSPLESLMKVGVFQV
ncbi:MAG: acyl-CoA carboxylase subunit beta, partial [Chitinophagaceae bacterium]|nr:acyl-CoA carboxylase subunit beta [Chitinophagaceae bacterium]